MGVGPRPAMSRQVLAQKQSSTALPTIVQSQQLTWRCEGRLRGTTDRTVSLVEGTSLAELARPDNAVSFN